MSLAQYRQKIQDFVCGDSLRIERTITSVPSGTTLSKAYLTIKSVETDLDASAILQLSITSTSTASGQITDTGSDGTGTVRFTLSGTQTLLMTPGITYFFDVQVILSDGSIYTCCKGTIIGLQQITIATT